MDSVLVLIAAPGSGAIDGTLVRHMTELLAAPVSWLATGEAAEWKLSPSRLAGTAEIAAHMGERPIDVAAVPAANRRKRLLIADMDSTMIGQECIDELGVLAGVGPKISAITARAMAGELDFEAALRERLALMSGLEAARISEVLEERLTFTAGGRELVATMKAHGARTVIVSGGFLQFTSYVAERLGFDEHRANELIIEAGALTGKAREPILGQAAKLEALRQI